jgi:hypothetical protein
MKAPECFEFLMTDNTGQRTFGTVLAFDEPLDPIVRQALTRGDPSTEKLQT